MAKHALDLFEELGNELSQEFTFTAQGDITLMLEDKWKLQCEIDPNQRTIHMCFFVRTLSSTPLDIELFQKALIYNSHLEEPFAAFAFIPHSNALVLYRPLIAHNLSGKEFYQIILQFLEIAKEWERR